MAQRSKDKDEQAAEEPSTDQPQEPQVGEAGIRQAVPNVSPEDQPAGPSTTRFAMGAKTFTRWGSRWEVVSTSDQGVLAARLEDAPPKSVYMMAAPADEEYDEQAPPESKG